MKCSRLTLPRLAAGLRWSLLLLLVNPGYAADDQAETENLSPEWHVRPIHSDVPGEKMGAESAVEVQFPSRHEIEATVDPGAWQGWKWLNVSIELPQDFPANTVICFFTKDWDHLWRQVRLPVLPKADGHAEFRLPLVGGDAAAAWDPEGHNRPWHALTPGQVRRFGFRFSTETGEPIKWSGQLRITSVQLEERVETSEPLVVKDIRLHPTDPRVGRLCETRIRIGGYYKNPFAPSDIAVQATITRPDGRKDEIRGFYYEGFMPEPDGLQDRLVPHGAPEFRIRYMARVKGRHVMKVEITGEHGVLSLPPLEFQARPPASGYKGVVRIDPDNPLLMEYESGREFRGIGLNLRAPLDVRYLRMAPFSEWQDEGLQTYQKMFPKLAAAGVNTVEVWMSSWWLALEWINDAPGFHGVGYYNQYRAWMLDQLIKLAEDNDIYLILVLNNHGKFSSFCDQEWDRNPYNHRNGGWLKQPNDYFREEKARQAFKRTADYIVSRWGYSKNILCWKLFSEINLTGSSNKAYKQPFMENWHREMAEYLKKIDPNQHMITTHWSSNYQVINDSIAEIDALDFLTTDAYAGSTRQAVQYFRGTVKYGDQKNKPALITEFGGSSGGDALGTLLKQLHMSLWDGYFSRHAIAPMLWWFAIVEEQNLYSEYKSLAAFSHDLDRREMKENSYRLAEQNMTLKTLHDARNVLAWGYDHNYYYARDENDEAPIIEGVSINVSGLTPANYRLEIWDCRSDAPIEVRSLKIYRRGDKRDIIIPPFRRDFALKITPE